MTTKVAITFDADDIDAAIEFLKNTVPDYISSYKGMGYHYGRKWGTEGLDPIIVFIDGWDDDNEQDEEEYDEKELEDDGEES